MNSFEFTPPTTNQLTLTPQEQQLINQLIENHNTIQEPTSGSHIGFPSGFSAD